MPRKKVFEDDEIYEDSYVEPIESDIDSQGSNNKSLANEHERKLQELNTIIEHLKFGAMNQEANTIEEIDRKIDKFNKKIDCVDKLIMTLDIKSKEKEIEKEINEKKEELPVEQIVKKEEKSKEVNMLDMYSKNRKRGGAIINKEKKNNTNIVDNLTAKILSRK